jgi:hypothetical protein
MASDGSGFRFNGQLKLARGAVVKSGPVAVLWYVRAAQNERWFRNSIARFAYLGYSTLFVNIQIQRNAQKVNVKNTHLFR